MMSTPCYHQLLYKQPPQKWTAARKKHRAHRKYVLAISRASTPGTSITGAIVGVGAARRLSAVRWNVASSIVYAWVITIPASAIIAAATWWATSLVVRLHPF